MEVLQHLSDVQSILKLLRANSLSSEDVSNDHFFAEFLLLTVRACKHPDELVIKCRFITEQIQQILTSSAVLENLFEVNKKGLCKDIMPMDIHGTCCPIQNCQVMNGETASVTLGAMEQAKSTLEDFCRSYYMFHNMDSQNPCDIFKHFPILAFVESYIYQIDERKEEQLLPSSGPTLKQVQFQGDAFKAPANVQDDCFKPLCAALADRNLLNIRIEEELNEGKEYWALEHYLCSSLLIEKEISLSDVIRAVKLKSFDYRVLNLLLYELSEQPVNEMHMEFLSVSEFLVEISDDLFDYEEDVLKNSFNILRMLLRIYGPDKAPCKLAQVISEAEEKYKKLLEKLEPQLASQYQKRCQEAVVEGGSSSKHPMGSWILPSLILDERMYRRVYRDKE